MKYVAFFRGINVGGKNSVKMADLRDLLTDCGFQNVATYIQSGNALFDSEAGPKAVTDRIVERFSDRFGFQSPIVLRSAEEFQTTLSEQPFTEAEISQAQARNPKTAHLYYFLSDQNIDLDAVEQLRQSTPGEDQLKVGRRTLYLLLAGSIRNSKLAASLMKFDPPLTSRNHKTMLKMRELLEK